MQTIQWTNELIVIASLIGIALAGLGFLMATVVQGRKVARLTAQLEQLQGNLEQADALNQSLQDSMKDLESSLHEKDLAESRLQAQLTGAQSNEQRLTDELRSQKEEFTSVNAKLEESRQRHHATERQLETSQADNRALQERVDDLRERLGRAELAQGCAPLQEGVVRAGGRAAGASAAVGDWRASGGGCGAGAACG